MGILKTYRISWLLVVGLFIQTVQSQTLSSELQKGFNAFLALPALKHAQVSYVVLGTTDGARVFDYQGHIGLVPASTLKVLTSATAFETLSPDFKFTTHLGISGSIDSQGVLKGDLIVRGTGDPSLGSNRFNTTGVENVLTAFSQAIIRAGIKKIEGRLVLDDLLMGGQQAPKGWTWQDMGNYFGAGVSALNWQENQFSIQLQPGKTAGSATKLLGFPSEMSHLHFINEVITGPKGSGDQVYAFAAPYSRKIVLRGSYGMDLKKQIQLAVPDGASSFGLHFKKHLAQIGIEIKEDIYTTFNLKSSELEIPKITRELYVYSSPSLSEIVYYFNQKSINLYGEALLRRAFLEKIPNGSLDKASDWMRDLWASQTHVSKAELRLMDGSGLSPENRITASALANLMLEFQKKKWYAAFYESLPVINGLKMKSGTIGGVLTYTGVHTQANGQSYVFALMVNNYEGTAANMRPQLWKLLNQLK